MIIPGAGFIYMGRIRTGITNLIATPFVYTFFWFSGYGLFAISGEAEGGVSLLLVFFGLAFFVAPVAAHLSMVVEPFRAANKMHDPG